MKNFSISSHCCFPLIIKYGGNNWLVSIQSEQADISQLRGQLYVLYMICFFVVFLYLWQHVLPLQTLYWLVFRPSLCCVPFVQFRRHRFNLYPPPPLLIPPSLLRGVSVCRLASSVARAETSHVWPVSMAASVSIWSCWFLWQRWRGCWS